MKQFQIAILFLVFALSIFAQTDGKIIEQKDWTFPQATVDEIVKTKPAEKVIFDDTKIKDITYLSDGLKIKGFVGIQPR